MVVSCVEDNNKDRGGVVVAVVVAVAVVVVVVAVVAVVVASSVPIVLLVLMLMLMLLHKYVLRDKFFSAIRCISPSLTFTKPNQTKQNHNVT